MFSVFEIPDLISFWVHFYLNKPCLICASFEFFLWVYLPQPSFTLPPILSLPRTPLPPFEQLLSAWMGWSYILICYCDKPLPLFPTTPVPHCPCPCPMLHAPFSTDCHPFFILRAGLFLSLLSSSPFFAFRILWLTQSTS